QEHRRNGLSLGNALIGVLEGSLHEAKESVFFLDRLFRFREKLPKQLMLAQQVKRLARMTGLEQLEEFVEQACRRDVPEQGATFRDRIRNGCVDSKVELCRETYRSQHPHGIFAQALVRVSNEDQPPEAHVLDASNVVPDAEVGNVVIQRVTGEIPAPDVFFDLPVDVVAENSSFEIVRDVGIVFER